MWHHGSWHWSDSFQKCGLHPVCWGVTPCPLCQCHCSHSSGLTRGQLDAFLVESLDWLLTSLNFLTAELDRCLCWRWPGREGWQDQPPVVVNCFQNHALVEKAAKGSVFKKCQLDCVLCLLSKLREIKQLINQLGVIEFEILALVFLLVGDFCTRTSKLHFYLVFLQHVSPVKLVSS